MVTTAPLATQQIVYSRPETLTDTPTHYCPGCTHGVAHRLVAEVLEEMGVREKDDWRGLMGGCSVLLA